MLGSVAVIGGGIFGCMTALELARNGFDVTIFERQKNIMAGASKNNQNRLHRGFHYPRDIKTAKQCINGFKLFVDEFPESIRDKTTNVYYIASSGSKTTAEEYISFCDTMKLPYTVTDLLSNDPIEVKNVSLGILCDEVIYDCDILRELLIKKFNLEEVVIKCETDVVSVVKKKSGFLLFFKDQPPKYFDAVVNCSYGDINRLTNTLGHKVNKYQFEYTIIPIVESSHNMALTVMDGPFLTFLPYGKTQQSLLYHVTHSVIDTVIDTTMPESWRNENNPFTKINHKEVFENMREATINFFPVLKDMKLVDFLHGPRMVMSKCEDTDARPSLVNNYGEGYITVFSGKIDHCINVASEVCNLLLCRI